MLSSLFRLRFCIALLACCSFYLLSPFADKLPAEDLHAAKGSASAVQIAPVRLVEEGTVIRVPGTVEAVERSTIAARISAAVVAVPVKLGDRVEKGQVLVRLQAGELNARVSRTRAQLEQVRRNLARETRLLNRQAATAESVRGLRDAERIAAAGVQEAEAMLAYTVITAPYSGVVSKKLVNSGDLAAPGMPLLELENTAALQVRAQAPEEIAGALALDSTVPVLLPVSGRRLETKLVEIAPAANPAARSATIILAVNNSDTVSLRSGQYLQVVLPGTGDSRRLVVPSAAVSTWGQMERVFVLEGDRARLRLVRTGALLDAETEKDEHIEITGGLNEGELLILNPPAQLSHDQQVQVRP